MSAQNFNFTPNFVRNGGLKPKILHFVQKKFPTKSKFFDRLKFGVTIASPLPRRQRLRRLKVTTFMDRFKIRRKNSRIYPSDFIIRKNSFLHTAGKQLLKFVQIRNVKNCNVRIIPIINQLRIPRQNCCCCGCRRLQLFRDACTGDAAI